MFSILKKFREGLRRTAGVALNSLTSLFAKKIDEADIALIEETLYGADFGYETASEIVEAIRREYSRNRELRGKEAAQIGADVLCKILEGSEADFIRAADGNPSVVCLVGVNGAGKTTTAAKLASPTPVMPSSVRTFTKTQFVRYAWQMNVFIPVTFIVCVI